MVSKVFMICVAYESGLGHGLQKDGFDLSKTPHADPDCGEAYQNGYDRGLAIANDKHYKGATPLDRSELSMLANKAFTETVDCDMLGNPITSYDVLLNGAYGPAVARLCNEVLRVHGKSNVQYPIPEDTSGVDEQIRTNNILNKSSEVNAARNAIYTVFDPFKKATTPDQRDIINLVDAAFYALAKR